MERPGSLGCPYRHKRTHGDMEGPRRSHSSVSFHTPRSSPPPPTAAPSTPTYRRTTPTPLPPRFPGDGFDFRRPAANPRQISEAEFTIDLTGSDDEGGGADDEDVQMTGVQPRAVAPASRLPRFPRNLEIIDLSNDTPPFARQRGGAAAQNPTPESPEVQFLEVRQRAEAEPHVHNPFGENPRVPQFAHHPARILIDSEDEDEEGGVQFLEERPLPPRAPPPGQAAHPARPNQMRHPLVQFLAQQVGRDFVGNVFGGFNVAHIALPQMNYTLAAFDVRPRTPPRPTYDPPAPAPEGFTRTPKEDEVLICPLCEDELCTGDDDIKRQVWVAKGCGHAYCGECAANRHSTKRKGKQPASSRSQPFSHCVVEECGKKLSHPKHMVQLFL